MKRVQTSERKKTYRLFKRDPGTGREIPDTTAGWRELPYYFRFTFRGKSYVRCLETNDSDEAQKYARGKADEIRDGVLNEDHAQLDRTKARQGASSTIGDVVKTYRACGVDANTDTRQQNIHALNLILRKVYETEACDTLSLTKLNSATARTWFEIASRESAAVAAGKDPDSQRRAASIKRSANSRFGHARSMFNPVALAAYEAAGLAIPDCVEEFIARTSKFRRLPRVDYNPPSDAIIQATLQAWEQLDDRNLFLAIGHELAFGLRKGELAQAKWSWWTVRQGYPVLDGSAHVKNNTGFLQVRALDPWFSIMRDRIQTKGWRSQPDEYIITGNVSNREDSIFRAVGMFLREHKWETQKTNHAMRGYAGSQIAMVYGIYEAQTWLRHSTVKVTENHYSQYVKRFKPADVNTLPARWAQAQAPAAAPELRIVNA